MENQLYLNMRIHHATETLLCEDTILYVECTIIHIVLACITLFDFEHKVLMCSQHNLAFHPGSTCLCLNARITGVQCHDLLLLQVL